MEKFLVGEDTRGKEGSSEEGGRTTSSSTLAVGMVLGLVRSRGNTVFP